MTLNLILVIPDMNIILTIMWICCAIVMIFLSVVMFHFRMMPQAIVFFCLGFGIITWLVYNMVVAMVPILPYPWNEILFNALHPQNPINITVVWPK
jgi:hypothetical protein